MKYTIGNKVFHQKPLVLGQIEQLIHFIRENKIIIPSEITIPNIVMAFGDKLSQALAIVLIKEGEPLSEKDLKTFTKEIAFTISPETTLEVIEHFFDCNHIPSLLEKLTRTITRISEKTTLAGLKTSASSSQEETSQKETISSGDIPSENASLMLSIESEK